MTLADSPKESDGLSRSMALAVLLVRAWPALVRLYAYARTRLRPRLKKKF